MVNGQLDISSLPLDYASGKVRAFSATLMPALVRNHERAARLNNSPFMKEIKSKIERAGVVVLADAWLAGAVASKKGCIRRPEDLKGLKIRSAGPTFAAMWQKAGGSIVSIPSNEVYNALQTGVADATDTSAGSFVSFRLYEQVKCLTAPGENALWFMYEPVLMSKRSFDRLNKAQQDALLAAGKKAEAYFNKATKALDDKMVDVFKKNNVEVITLGRVDGFDQDEAEGERDEGTVIARSLLATKCDALEALEFADGLLDARPRFVEDFREESGSVGCSRAMRNDRTNAALAGAVAIGFGVVTFVGDGGARQNIGSDVEQEFEVAAVAGFAPSQMEGERQAVEVDVDFG